MKDKTREDIESQRKKFSKLSKNNRCLEYAKVILK